MEQISKAKVISKAFIDTALMKIPSNEKDFPDWYKDRMDKCKVCKFNTRNIPYRILPTVYAAHKLIGKYQCSICSCFIKQKAWSKTEVCAMGETDVRPEWMPIGHLNMDDGLDDFPRWNRMEVVTGHKDDFDLISLDEHQYNVQLDENCTSFQLMMEPVLMGSDISFSFGLRAKRDVQIVATHVSCLCTSPKLEVISERNFKFSMKINTNGFGEGDFVKHLTLEYKVDGEEDTRKIEFDFMGRMIKKRTLSDILSESGE